MFAMYRLDLFLLKFLLGRSFHLKYSFLIGYKPAPLLFFYYLLYALKSLHISFAYHFVYCILFIHIMCSVLCIHNTLNVLLMSIFFIHKTFNCVNKKDSSIKLIYITNK